jgi:hypothetical protein
MSPRILSFWLLMCLPFPLIGGDVLSVRNLKKIHKAQSEKNLPRQINATKKKIYFNPEYIKSPNWFQENSETQHIVNHGMIRLARLNEKFLMNLSIETQKKLFKFLSKKKIKIRVHDNESHNLFRKVKWEKTTADTAILLKLETKESKLFPFLAALNPEAGGGVFKGKRSEWLTEEKMTDILLEIISLLKTEEGLNQAIYGSHIVKFYMKNNGKKPQKNGEALTWLLYKIGKKIDKEDLSLKQKGMLLGIILSGCFLHANDVKTKDEDRIFMLNAVANLAWAATSYVGVIPMALTAGAALAGSLSVVAVASQIFFSKSGIRDLSPSVKEIQGYIEFYALERAQSAKAKKDVLEAFRWMGLTLHLNGLSN